MVLLESQIAFVGSKFLSFRAGLSQALAPGCEGHKAESGDYRRGLNPTRIARKEARKGHRLSPA